MSLQLFEQLGLPIAQVRQILLCRLQFLDQHLTVIVAVLQQVFQIPKLPEDLLLVATRLAHLVGAKLISGFPHLFGDALLPRLAGRILQDGSCRWVFARQCLVCRKHALFELLELVRLFLLSLGEFGQVGPLLRRELGGRAGQSRF